MDNSDKRNCNCNCNCNSGFELSRLPLKRAVGRAVASALMSAVAIATAAMTDKSPPYVPAGVSMPPPSWGCTPPPGPPIPHFSAPHFPPPIAQMAAGPVLGPATLQVSAAVNRNPNRDPKGSQEGGRRVIWRVVRG
eukprot:1177937-Prorocentrum_minimum.AAC.3